MQNITRTPQKQESAWLSYALNVIKAAFVEYDTSLKPAEILLLLLAMIQEQM